MDLWLLTADGIREIYGSLAAIRRTCVPVDARPLLDDVVDQFSRVYAIADGQKEYLQGVIDFYRTRSDTKMTVAAERLAVIAVMAVMSGLLPAWAKRQDWW